MLIEARVVRSSDRHDARVWFLVVSLSMPMSRLFPATPSLEFGSTGSSPPIFLVLRILDTRGRLPARQTEFGGQT
jgi:hypothetical protein